MIYIIIPLLAFILTLSLVAQNKVAVPKNLQNIRIKSTHDRPLPDELQAGEKADVSILSTEEQIGDTRYDNQSNASIPKKMYLFPDGTIAATWTRSMDEGSFFSDRGTGYNYFDGSAWQAMPTTCVEDIKVHRPVYAPFGENGELIVSHTSGDGLYMATRPDKGSGDWSFETFPGPAGDGYILWCRAVTSGPDHNRIHLLALTLPTSHGGSLYEGLDGALLYSLSNDGGNTWEMQNEVLDGMTADDYTGFEGDSYAFAEPVGDAIAFVVGNPWTGLFMMKSTDGGENFDKTTIWEHPYPGWELGMPTDTFYCADGAQSLALDNTGRAHVAFGISRVQADDENTYWYPWVDGIAYWNEDMPAFTNNLHALDPNDHPESELILDYNLIGWTQDVNGNGELEFKDDMGLYWIGLSSQPQISIDDNDRVFLIYSSVTETFDNGLKNYRHIWMRAATALGQNWSSQFVDLTSDFVHIFDECVYPATTSHSDNSLYIMYQYDTEPGTAVWGSQQPYVDNNIGFIKFDKADLALGTENKISHSHAFELMQNAPNPLSTTTKIGVKTFGQSSLSLSITNVSGREVYSARLSETVAGEHFFTIPAASFSAGMYFYTVSDNEQTVTKKMLVK